MKYEEITGKQREEKLSELKKSLKTQQNLFSKHRQLNEESVKVSYILSEMIAKHSKPFTEGEFVKECILKSVELVCPEKKNLFANISLSAQTVTRRIEELSENISQQLIDVSRSFAFYSLALDESVDCTDTSQLAIFIRGINNDFEIHEELLKLVPIYDTNKGVDIFNKLIQTLEDFSISLNRLTSVTTDGAPAMIGKNIGLIALVKDKLKSINANSILVNYHCIIHQQALCSQYAELSNVMEIVVKTVNKIRSNSLAHRQFKVFLSEIDAEYGDLLYYSKIRWLSRGKVLLRFFELREEINFFMINKDRQIEELSDPIFVLNLAFLVDITSYLNELNLKLQGKDQLVTEVYSHILAFQAKLQLWENQISSKNFLHFICLQQVHNQFLNSTFNYDSIINVMRNLKLQFQDKFADFKNQKFIFELFSSPFDINVDDSPESYQMELIELKASDSLKSKFQNMLPKDFYIHLHQYFPHSFQSLKRNAKQIISMFGSTYMCEQLFSAMKINKTKLTNRISDNHLNDRMKIMNAKKLKPNIDVIIDKKQCQASKSSNK
jgi:hypothetical protein